MILTSTLCVPTSTPPVTTVISMLTFSLPSIATSCSVLIVNVVPVVQAAIVTGVIAPV